jgi:hypothetical protein
LYSPNSSGATSTNRLAQFKVQLPGTEGIPRGKCESCNASFWSDGAYRIPSLPRLYCSLLCIECGIAHETGKTKRIEDHPIGDGLRLVKWLDQHSTSNCNSIEP